MYTWEIEKFLVEHNRTITIEEFYKIINKVDNPQIKDVTYDSTYGRYNIETDDGKVMEVFVKNRRDTV